MFLREKVGRRMRGFEGAPFSWVFLILTVLSTLILGNLSSVLALNLQRMVSGGEWYRLLTCQLFFPSTPQAVVGVVLTIAGVIEVGGIVLVVGVVPSLGPSKTHIWCVSPDCRIGR